MSALELVPNEKQAAPSVVTPMYMLDKALASGADISVLEKLMALQERWQANQARQAFDAAIAAAKAKIPIIVKNRTVDFTSSKGRTHYKHEDLAEVARTVAPILGSHGLSYRFRSSSNPGEPVTVTCIISHRDGHFEENTLSAGRDESGNKNSIQAVGSTLTYLQRMTLKASLGLAASDDDDGANADAVTTKHISGDQLRQVVDLCDEVDADKEKFCKYLKVGSLAEIPSDQFSYAVSLLEAKRKGGSNADR